MNIMKTTSYNCFSIVYIMLLLVVSCSDTPSLQRYFVDHQEAPNFITQDVPISILKIDESALTNKQQEAYQSVSRLNFLGYKQNDQNSESLNTELTTVKAILNQEQYNSLIEFRNKGIAVELKYIGNDDKVDEFVLLGVSPDMGFGIVRILGQDMTPEKMVTLVELLQKSDINEEQFKKMFDFFNKE